ncbi:MAG: RNase adapter RapZ [Thiotrichales bacterium]
MKIFIVSGLSGSGKSIALNAFEDEGHYCIDNLPIQLLLPTVKELAQNPSGLFDKVALGIDARSGHEQLKNIDRTLKEIEAISLDLSLIYLQASEDVLVKRYGETRRKHPLTHQGRSLVDAIREEQKLLQPVASRADLAIDSSRLNVHELTLLIKTRTQVDLRAGNVSIMVQSFGFRHGVPLDSDFVFDLRCLPNPHWIKDLRPLTGKEEPIVHYLEQHEEVEQMFDSIRDFFDVWIPQIKSSNRSYITISVGCTGGRHRSVYMAERLYAHLRTTEGNAVLLKHREIS